MKQSVTWLLVFILMSTLFFVNTNPVIASTTNGTIGNSYASILLDNTAGLWPAGLANTEKIFWNAPAPYEVHITDSSLTGYLWGPGVGWISLNCINTNSCGTSDFKVANTDSGVLSGYAWGENTGWISFSCANPETNNCGSNNNAKVTITTDGQLSGYAWSQNFGWIKFDCSTATACVQTDWRPASVRGGFSGGGGNIGGGIVLFKETILPLLPKEIFTEKTIIQFPGCSGDGCQTPPPSQSVYPKYKLEDSYVYALNTPLVVKPEQTGKLDQDTHGHGRVTVEIVPQVSSELLKIIVDPKVQTVSLRQTGFAASANSKGYIFRVTASDQNDRVVHKLNKDILVTLPIPEPLQNKRISVFSRDNEQVPWTPATIVSRAKTTVTVKVNHLSDFMITGADSYAMISLLWENLSWTERIIDLLLILMVVFVVTRKIRLSKLKNRV